MLFRSELYIFKTKKLLSIFYATLDLAFVLFFKDSPIVIILNWLVLRLGNLERQCYTNYLS